MRSALLRSLVALLLVAGCSSAQRSEERFSQINLEGDPVAAQNAMCVEENVGITRHDRGYLEQFCPELKSQLALVCFRFVRNTRDWRKACGGINTPDQLECISVLQNGAGYALLDSLAKCQRVANRKQVFCLSRLVAKSGAPLEPSVVQECLDKNP